MKLPDQDECMRIGLALIEEHGENVGPFIRSKIDALWGTDDYEETAKWLAIQNAVGFVVNNHLDRKKVIHTEQKMLRSPQSYKVSNNSSWWSLGVLKMARWWDTVTNSNVFDLSKVVLTGPLLGLLIGFLSFLFILTLGPVGLFLAGLVGYLGRLILDGFGYLFGIQDIGVLYLTAHFHAGAPYYIAWIFLSLCWLIVEVSGAGERISNHIAEVVLSGVEIIFFLIWIALSLFLFLHGFALTLVSLDWLSLCRFLEFPNPVIECLN